MIRIVIQRVAVAEPLHHDPVQPINKTTDIMLDAALADDRTAAERQSDTGVPVTPLTEGRDRREYCLARNFIKDYFHAKGLLRVALRILPFNHWRTTLRIAGHPSAALNDNGLLPMMDFIDFIWRVSRLSWRDMCAVVLGVAIVIAGAFFADWWPYGGDYYVVLLAFLAPGAVLWIAFIYYLSRWHAASRARKTADP